ncbi:spore germination protein KA [Aneurinibacillus migulanus]|uniref:Spore germination protein KA n=2 Tax=Aneurinibacillus migulanus TaxID=47500 RepID=A0A1G8PCX5_ANEMI|nr:spore germination protein KA [Aneurinibacillus migulanus]
MKRVTRMGEFKKPKRAKTLNEIEQEKEQEQTNTDVLKSKPLEEIGIDPITSVNGERLKAIFKDVDVFVSHPLTFLNAKADSDGRVPEGGVFFLDDMVNEDILDQHVIRPLLEMGPESFFGQHVEDQVITAKKMVRVDNLKTAVEMITTGSTLVHVDDMDHIIAVITCGFPSRSVAEPEAEPLVRGPREGFTEKLQDNTALIRKRLRTPELKSEMIKIGQRSHTMVCFMYMRELVEEDVLNTVRQRLQKVDIDILLESAQLEELIEDSVYSPFPQMISTERPDKVVSALTEGRVAIIIDGTPFVLVVPSVFYDFMQASEDFYQRFYFSTAIRLLRTITFLIALLGPSFYIAITTFHQELIPTPLLLTVISARAGVPFPALVEALIMEVSFEVLREAGVRLPRPVGSAVSIVGALVVGQAAVEAGIISQAMVIVVAFTGIASFTIPAFNMSMSTRLLRFPMMLIAAGLGLFGIAIALVALGIHMCSLRTFGVPYMSPIAPMHGRTWGSEIFVLPYPMRKWRQEYIQKKDLKRSDMPANPPQQQGGEQ